jgi:hypothetical protein
MPPTTKWRPADYNALIGVSTACLCMLILVCGVVIGVLDHRIALEKLGDAKGITAGSGLLGFMALLTAIVLGAGKRGRS